MRYDINPFMPHRAYRLPKANIALEGNIANHVRDLYRCVFSVKDNTLKSRGFIFKKNTKNNSNTLAKIIISLFYM